MKLLAPYALSDLPSRPAGRMVMAPMTRNRASSGGVPGDMNARYYRQRASAGLIVTEATRVEPKGQGYPSTPGIHENEQVEGWKKVTRAVHDAGGRIFLQLQHCGRVSHPSFHGGEKPVAPSALRPEGEKMAASGEEAPYVTPRALQTGEVEALVGSYRRGAEHAKAAGFDGVEIHGANGYLVDQFLRSGSNRRTDRYSGSVENRARFLLEVAEAATAVWGPERVGVRVSPLNGFNDMSDANPKETFGYAADALSGLGLAYLHVVEDGSAGGKPPTKGAGGDVFARVREVFTGPIIANSSYDRSSAEAAIQSGHAQLVSFGRAFLANPDLPERFRRGTPLNEPRPDLFYGGGAEGYVDYPTLEEIEAGKSEALLDSTSYFR